ncbi:MAG: hypothetical protein QM718_09825 [Steroidobacteraceae bacterium]
MMQRTRQLAGLLTGLLMVPLFATLAQAAAPAGGAALQLDADTQRRMGLTLVTLQKGSALRSQPATALVLDPLPLIKLDADLQAASAAAAAADAELQRLRGLSDTEGTVSQKNLEAAQAQSLADGSHLQALRQELQLSWGIQIAQLPANARAALVASLSGNRSQLLRVEPLTPEAAAAPAGIALQLPGNAAAPAAKLLGPLPQAASGSNGTAWLVQTQTATLAVGMSLSAQWQTTTRDTGIVLPRAALLRWNGLTWVYVATDTTHFERRVVSDALAGNSGWWVSQGFQAGERVVTTGAAQLLATQTLASDSASASQE